MTAPPGDSEDHHPHAPNLAPATPGPARRRGGARLRRCASAGFPALRMAVNLSGSNLGHPDLVAANLELELTESVAIAESVGALATLQDLKALGLHLAIDDFGTGYSALSRLRADNRHGIGEVEPGPRLGAAVGARLTVAARGSKHRAATAVALTPVDALNITVVTTRPLSVELPRG